MHISACNDEISTNLEVALDALEREGIQHVDLRGVGGKTWLHNVVELSDEEAVRARNLIAGRGFKVSAISSPVGKTRITDDFGPELARFQRALELAKLFDTQYVRVFSFFATEDEARTHRAEALRRLRRLCELAQPHGISVVHENEEGEVCVFRPEDCLAFHRELPENFRCVFEACSFTVAGYDAYADALPLLRPYIAYAHIRDTRRGTTDYQVAGEGDARWPEILADFKQRGFQGYLTLEPHLIWEKYEDVTDARRIEYFQRAHRALLAVMENLPSSS